MLIIIHNPYDDCYQVLIVIHNLHGHCYMIVLVIIHNPYGHIYLAVIIVTVDSVQYCLGLPIADPRNTSDAIVSCWSLTALPTDSTLLPHWLCDPGPGFLALVSSARWAEPLLLQSGLDQLRSPLLVSAFKVHAFFLFFFSLLFFPFFSFSFLGFNVLRCHTTSFIRI